MNDGLILGIETSGLLCSVGWMQSGKVILEYNMEIPQVHASKLANLVKEGFSKIQKSMADLSLVAVGTGPGSFTGLRIGMSFAKGLCYGTGVPILGVSAFNILAKQAPDSNEKIITLIDAKKERFYNPD